MVTIEPVLDFDLSVMLDWIEDIDPAMIWIGYDSKGCGLTEPSLAKVKELHWRLSGTGRPAILKTIREPQAVL
jgi:hypothetical protein